MQSPSPVNPAMRHPSSAHSSLAACLASAIVANLILTSATSIQGSQAAVIPIPPPQHVNGHAHTAGANLHVGIPTSRSRTLPSPKPTTTPAATPAPADAATKAASPFPLGTYQVDPFHTITFRADNSALIAAQQLCFQQADCPATTFAGSWTFEPDSQQLRVATTSPMVSAMRWQFIPPASPSAPRGVLKVKFVPGSEEGDFPVEPRLNVNVITAVGRASLRAMGRASVDGHGRQDGDEDEDEDEWREGEEPWMYIEGP